MAITKEEAIKRDLKKLGVFVYKKDGDTVFFKKDITAALKKLKVIAEEDAASKMMKKDNIKRDLNKLGISAYRKDGDTVVFKKDIAAALTRQSITADAKYSVYIELNEEGSSDHITEIVISKKIAEGLKMLDAKKLAMLKKLLREVFVKVAVA